MERIVIDVEVCQKVYSTLERNEIKHIVMNSLNVVDQLTLDEPIELDKLSSDLITEHIFSIICSLKNNKDQNNNIIRITEGTGFRVFIYQATLEDAATETMQSDSEDLPVSSQWILPSHEFHGLWENLCYSPNIKENLLNYIETTMEFSNRNVDSNIISWNRVVLLHGPPGTGKTSLCKALAQKATIRMHKYFSRGQLVEINSHSLFSKWFSESGKLVMKLFNSIKLLLEDSESLVCILIDEVESLAHARKSCTNGTEPSDSIRVVNALLTQLDQIKRYKNVLILTTSNVTEAIDLAFVDRADIKQFIGYPDEKAIAKIYLSCIGELAKTGLVKVDPSTTDDKLAQAEATKLIKLSIGLSGRALRKIPFLAYALFKPIDKVFDYLTFNKAMIKAVEKYKHDELINDK